MAILPGIAPIVASAATPDIYVNQTGWWRADGAFNASATRIQAAINNATAGDTIYVYHGSYTENVDVNKQVTLQGEGPGVVTVTNSTADNHVFTVSADYVNISGFNVTGATGHFKAGIYLSSNHSNISDNNASNNFVGFYLVSSSNNTLTNNTANSNYYDGIFLESLSNNNTLTNNTANSNYYDGIQLESSSNNTLTNNTANSNTLRGIFLESLSNNNTLTNNTANSNTDFYGIHLASSSNNMLTNNTANSNYYEGIFLVSSSNNTLTNNTANSNTYYGIYLQSSRNNTLTNNTANSNKQHGIFLQVSSNNNTLTNNTANSNVLDGIEIWTSSNNTLTNNTASNNSVYGIYLSTSSNNTIYNNYFNNTNNVWDNGNNTWNTTITAGTNIIGGSSLGGNYWSNYAGADTNRDGMGNTLTPYNNSGNIQNGGDYNPLAAVGGPSTFYVNTTGWWRADGAFNASAMQIQAAIDNATDGDTIYVYNGSYSENVNVNKRVTLQGEGAGVVTVTNSTANNHVFTVSASYVNISGFKTGATGVGYAGIYLGSSVGHVNISNNNASNNYYGIYLYSSSNNNTLTNNTASNNYFGILLSTSSNNTLTNNTANSNSYNGIALQTSSNNNTLTNNTANSNTQRGIYLYDSSNNNTLTNNTASNNSNGIELTSSSNNNTLTNNTASNNGYGIQLYTSSDNTIYNNYFNNTNNAYDNRNNTWNTTITVGTNIIGGSYLGGNYWSNYAGEDTDGDRLGDTLTPYHTGITYGGDYHPLMNVDTTASSITIISPVNTTYRNASIVLNVTTNQTVNVTYSLNGNGNQSLYNRTTSGNATITGTEGANNITIYANDSAGNLNSSIVYFTVDMTPPVIIINTPANGSTTNDPTPLLNATFSDETVTYAWYRVNNTGNSTPVSNTNNLTVTLSSLPDGAHNITVYANDSAGNLNSSIVYFTVDATSPVIIINTPANGSTTNDPTPLLNATFSGETVTYAWYRVNNTGNSTPVSNTNNLTVTLSSLPDGAHNITVYANDTAGNLNSSIVYFAVDTTAPSLSITQVTSPTNITYQNITGTIYDTGGIGTVTVNGIAATNGTGYYYYNLTGLVLGNNTITVIATDLADNVATNTTYILVISEVPAITGYAPSSSISDSTGATRTFNISIDQAVNVTWYLNGTYLYTNTNVTEANYTNSSAGSGTWNVTAIANNTNGTDSREWTWIVMADIMPPVITISVPVNNTNISIFDRIISGSITDESAITANMYVNSLFTNTWSSKGSFRRPYNFTNGSNTINISATDAYNNINWTNISVFVLSPVNEASLNLTANHSLNMTANDSAGVDVVLSTGNNTANVTVKINASINASHFNVSDIDTEFVALGIARKSLVKFVEINATGDVVNLSGVKITMFYNDSDLDLNGNGIIDAGDIKEDTLNLYWHWSNDTSGSQEWFPLTLGADYSGKFDRNNNSGPIVISVEKNTAFRYISVSTDHFSVYSIAGASIPATPTTTTPSGSSGSGSGGSGVVTEEPYENIAVYETIEKNIEAGKPVTYNFTKNQDIIYEVLVTGKENEYEVSMRIEILKNRSKQAKENAPGLVYRNANIISGTKNIGENVIKFKVNDSWLRENGFDSSDIRLVKWVDNKWITLETGVLFNKDGYTHFSAKSMTFSTYAITGIKKGESMPAPLATEKTAVTQDVTPFKPEPTLQPEGKISLWIWMTLAVLLVAGLVYVLKRR